MIPVQRKRVDSFLARKSWAPIFLVLAGLYAFGYALFPIFEGRQPPFDNLLNYTWYFVVTLTTVGYGDYTPQTPGGRVFGMLVMLFGIGTLALMVGRVAEKVYEARRRSMKGEMRLKLSGHIAILGYRSGETEQLVEEILADKVCQERDIVLCSSSIDENPMPDNIKFVKGELTSEEVLVSACVADAWRIVVHGRDDSQTITGVLAALSVNRTAHIVTIIDDPTNEVHVRRIDPGVECVLRVQVALTVQALQDPGATKVINPLLSNRKGDVLFKIDIPETAGPWAYEVLFDWFKSHFDATLIAMATTQGYEADVILNPTSNREIRGGMSLYYIRHLRILQIAWENVPREAGDSPAGDTARGSSSEGEGAGQARAA